jgi:hypothetical protein
MTHTQSWVDAADTVAADWADERSGHYTGRRRYTSQTCADPEGHRAKADAADERAGGMPEVSYRLMAEGRCRWCYRRLPR